MVSIIVQLPNGTYDLSIAPSKLVAALGDETPFTIINYSNLDSLLTDLNSICIDYFTEFYTNLN